MVRAAAVVQGLALVTVPTLSTVLTDPARFGLSQTAYGALFIPQSLLAIIFSLGGGRLTHRFGIKRMLLIGFAADTLSMGLLAAAALLSADHGLTYTVLLCATASLGFGFAVVTPALNLLSGAYAPASVDRAVLVVNALLGAAAALAPILLILFVGLGFWWGLPLLAGCAMLVLLCLSLRLPLDVAVESTTAGPPPQIPPRFWVFAAFALVYGICEQMNGSWAPLYITRELGGPAAFGSLALALFWALAAGGRVVFALLSRELPSTIVFRALPFVLAAAFAWLTFAPAGSGAAEAVGAYALAGLGVSALLPLVISFCERSMPEEATSVTSLVFAIYLIGYGLAAYGAGPLQRWGVGLSFLYRGCIVLALLTASLAFAIVHILEHRAHPTDALGEHA